MGDLKLLKQYNQLTIALRKQLKEDFEDMNENVKNMFEDYKELIPCIEENIGKDLGSKRRLRIKVWKSSTEVAKY